MAVNRSERDAPQSKVAMGVGALLAVLLVLWVILRIVSAVFFIVKIAVIVAAIALAGLAISKFLSKHDDEVR